MIKPFFSNHFTFSCKYIWKSLKNCSLTQRIGLTNTRVHQFSFDDDVQQNTFLLEFIRLFNYHQHPIPFKTFFFRTWSSINTVVTTGPLKLSVSGTSRRCSISCSLSLTEFSYTIKISHYHSNLTIILQKHSSTPTTQTSASHL